MFNQKRKQLLVKTLNDLGFEKSLDVQNRIVWKKKLYTRYKVRDLDIDGSTESPGHVDVVVELDSHIYIAYGFFGGVFPIRECYGWSEARAVNALLSTMVFAHECHEEVLCLRKA